MKRAPKNLEWLNIDCGRCGTGLMVEPDSQGRALVYEDEEVVCLECRTINRMGVHESYGDESDDYGDPIGSAYVAHWTCRHGQDEDTPCRWCDLADFLPNLWCRVRWWFQDLAASRGSRGPGRARS